MKRSAGYRETEITMIKSFVKQINFIVLILFWGQGLAYGDDGMYENNAVEAKTEILMNMLPPPSNDDLCDAIPLVVGAPCVGYAYTTIDATVEPDEYYCSYTAEKSVWFSFIAPESGTVFITTSREFPGSVYLTRMLYAFDEDFDCTDLTTIFDIDCNHDDGSIYDDTLAVCGLEGGLTYFIQIFSEDDPYEANFCIEVFEDHPDAGPDQLLCDQTMTTLSGSDFIYFPHLWEIVSGDATIDDGYDGSTTVSDLMPGSTLVLRRSLYCGEAVVDADTMTITNYYNTDDPNAGPDQQLCDVTTTTLAGNSPDFGAPLWTVLSGTAMILDPVDLSPDVTGLTIGGVSVLEYSFTNGTCVKRDTMMITVNAMATIADAGLDQYLCDAMETTLAGNTPLVGTGEWTMLDGDVMFSDPTSPTSDIIVGFDFNLLQWTITNGSCSSFDEVWIFLDVVPEPHAGPDQNLCNETETILAADAPQCIDGECETGLWTILSGSASIADATLENTVITGLIPGETVTLEWTVTSYEGYCSISDTVIIFNDEMPIADAGDDQGLCEEDMTTLNATTPLVGTGLWSVFGGVATITEPSSPTSGVTNLDPGYSAVWLLWTVTNGSCVSSDLMSIIVDEVPGVDAGADQEICDETFTTLDGSEPVDYGKSSESGLWTIISGSAIVTEPTEYNSGVTGLIPGTTVELVWTITSEAEICTVSDTMTITVYEMPTVADAGPDQMLCASSPMTTLEGNIPLAGTGMWTIIDGVATITDPSSPTTTVTDIATDVLLILEWTISNGICPASVDEVIISFEEEPTMADAGPDQMLCAVSPMTTLEGNSPVVGTGMWTIIDGVATITDPTSPTTTVTDIATDVLLILEWTISNGICPPSVDEVIISFDEEPTIADAGPDQMLCASTPMTTLEGNIPLAGTGMWTIIDGVATITDPSSPTTTVTDIATDVLLILEWTISNGICPASVDEVIISFDEEPTVADAGMDQELCDEISTFLEGNSPVVGTGLWTVVFGTATIDDPTSPTSEVTGLVPGTSATLEWTISNGVCPPSTDQVNIYIDELPSISDAGPDQELCNVDFTFLEGNLPNVGNGLWSIVSGTGNIVNPESPTSEINELEPGSSVTLEWSITNGSCPSSVDMVTIYIDETPTDANAGPDQILCNQLTTFLEGNTPLVGSGLWTVVMGSANVQDPESPVSQVTGLVFGSSVTLQWTIENGVCDASFDQVTITTDALPTLAEAGEDQQFCNLPSTTLDGNTPGVGSGLWSLISGSANIVNPESPTTEVDELIPGTTVVLQWEISNGECPATSDEVIIIIDALPSNANAGPDQFLCEDLSTFLEAEEPVIGIGEWTVIDGIANVVSPNNPLSEVTDLEYGTVVTLEWTIANETCPSSTDHVIIDVEDLPTEANAGPDQMLCGPTTTFLEGNIPVVGEGYWLKISGPGLIMDPELPNTEIIDLEYDMPTVCQWTIFGVNCPSSSDEVTIQAAPGGVESDAGPDQQICTETSVFLDGNQPLGAVGEWTVIMGTATIINPMDPNTEVTDFNQGETVVLQWALTPDGCTPSLDQMNIFVNTSGYVDAGPDQFLCDEISTTLNANTPDSGEGLWTVISGSAMIESPADPASIVSSLQPNSTLVLEWTITDGDCLPSKDTVEIMNSALPDVAFAGDDQSLCDISMTTLNATNPFIGSGEWNIISGTGTILSPDSPTSVVTDLVSGETVVLQWTVSNGACTSSQDEVEVFVDLPPSPAVAGSDQILCIENETVLSGNTPIIGTGNWSILSGTGTLSDPSSPVTAVTDLVYGSNVTLQWSIENGSCPSNNDTVFLSWHDMPSVAQAGEDQFLCKTTFATLEAIAPLTGEGHWTVISGAGIVVDPLSPTSVITGLVENASVTLHWTVSNATCQASIDDVVIHVDESPSPAQAGPDFVLCDESMITLDAGIPAIGEGTWTLISGNATILNPELPDSQVENLIPGSTTLLEWHVTNGACDGTRDTITIEIFELPTMAEAGLDQVVCGDTFTVLQANTPTVGQGIWSIESGSATLEDPTNPNTIISDLTFGLSVTLKWTITNGNCPISSSEITIEAGDAPTEADAGTDQDLCSMDETTLNANTPLLGTGEWIIISGTGMVVESNNPTSDVIGLDFNDPLLLEWVITEGICQSKDTVAISSEQIPTIALAGEDQVICGTETILDGNIPVVGTGAWTVISGTANVEDINNPGTSVTGISSGSIVVLQWTIGNACGESKDTVTISANSEVPFSEAGDDQVLCQAVSAMMSATPANIGSGTWSIISGAGTIQDPSVENTLINDLVPGTITVLRWTVSSDPCPPAFDDVIIQVDELPSVALAGADATICASDYVLSANTPLIGNGEWIIISGTGMLDDSFDPNSPVSGIDEGSVMMLSWNISNGVCSSNADTVSITATLPLTLPDAGSDEVYCNLPTIGLNANTPDPGQGSGLWTLISGSGIIEEPNDPNTVLNNPGQGTNVLVWTISNGVCLSLSDTVTIEVTAEQGLNANFLVSEVGCMDTLMYMFDISSNDIQPTGYLWDFGDNTTSTDRDPVHTYTSAGTFTITMVTFLNDCASIPVSKDIRVFACLLEEPTHYGSRQIITANVFPNPFDEDFKVSLKLKEENDIEITLYNVNGQLVEQRELSAAKEILTEFEVEAPGLYFVRIKVKDEVLVFKTIKTN